MARPPKWRQVEFLPLYTYFKPAGVPKRELEEVCLTIEEVEAIRLRDLEKLDQEACAARMHVSRPTFFRVLGSARRKIATALMEGKAIRIEGGHFRLSSRRFGCRACGYEWEAPASLNQKQGEFICPCCRAQGDVVFFSERGEGTEGPHRFRHRRGRA